MVPLPRAGLNLPYQDKMLLHHILHASHCCEIKRIIAKCLLALQKQDQYQSLQCR